MKVLVANTNPLHHDLVDRLTSSFPEGEFTYIDRSEDLTMSSLLNIDPECIFFPHWSTIIPVELYEKWECIVFHMTDLPYGRGGSPLQNLIIRGHQHTVVSALRVVEELDAGDIYLKYPLSLHGSAEEIFIRAGKVIESMILDILRNRPVPEHQTGTPTIFRRRTPEMSSIKLLSTLDEAYDMIRMLDAPGYPPAFFETDELRFEFSRVSRRKEELICDVRIKEKK